MRRRRAALSISGVVLLLGAPLWLAAAAPRWAQRIPPGWALSVQFIGTAATPDPATGAFPERDAVSVYQRDWDIHSDAAAGTVTLRSSYLVRDPATRSVTYDYVTLDEVDRRTGRLRRFGDPPRIGVFPRRTQRATYRWVSNYVHDLPLRFVRADTIEALPVYLFSYHGPAEYTASYEGTAENSGTTVPAGQVIRCADDAFYLRVAVEPVSGELVMIEEGCPTGDYLHDAATGARLAPVLRWAGATHGDALLALVARARVERSRYLWASRHVPLLLAAAGAAFLILALALRRLGARP